MHLTSHTTLSLPSFLCAPPHPPHQGSSSSGRTRSFSLLPHLTPSSSPGSQRHLSHAASPSNIVTITHHKSPAAARRAKSQYPGRLLEVKEVGAAGAATLKHLTLRQVASRSCCTDDTNVMLRSSWGRVTPQHRLRWSQLHWCSEFSSYLGLDCRVQLCWLFLWYISILMNMAGYRGKSWRGHVLWDQVQPEGNQ